MAKESPVFSVRIGGVQGSVWRNESREGDVFYNTAINRSYKDASGEWQTTDSFSIDDLPVVAKVADVCLTWLIRKQQEGK